MDPGNSSHYLSLEKNISIVFNNRRADIFCKNSDGQTHKNGGIPCKDNKAEMQSLWRSFETDDRILWNKKKQRTFPGKNNWIG